MKEESTEHRIRIGLQLNELREKQGLTYRQLAELTGLSFSNISKIEKGKYSVGLDVLQKIADALDADVTIMKR